MNERSRAKDIVDKIVEAERLGGGFRAFFHVATNMIEDILVENTKLKERAKALDDLQASTVQR